jgi:hypothetical protein
VESKEKREWGGEEDDEDDDEDSAEECDASHGEGILPRGDQHRTKGSIEKPPPFSTELRVGAKGGGFRVALKGKYRCRIHPLNTKPYNLHPKAWNLNPKP